MGALIQPVQRGAALLQDIEMTQPGAGQAAIWWLGQSGYAIKTASALWYVDLYLSEHLTAKYDGTEKPHIRMTEAPLRGHELNNAELVFSSHKHSDHLDPGTMPEVFKAAPGAQLVLSKAIVEHAVKLGLDRDRLIPARGDDTLTLGPLTVHVIPSAHPGLDYSEPDGYPFLGFVFEIDGLKLYHSGDTLVYDGLAERLRQHAPDVMFLPINGTSERLKALNVPPNMNYREAVALVQEVGAALMIPHHYDMFTFNTAAVNDFAAYADAQGVPYRVLRCGEKFMWNRQ